MDKTSIFLGIGGMIFTLIGTISGILINQRFIRRSTERQILSIAADKFRSVMMPFYHEICEMTGKDVGNIIGNNDTWIMRRMRQIIPEHRKFINEFRFSIPERYRHGFDIIADSHCPPQKTNSEDNIDKIYFSDGNMKVEMMYRNKVKTNLEKMMDFNIK